jgi:hypothetical protein
MQIAFQTRIECNSSQFAEKKETLFGFIRRQLPFLIEAMENRNMDLWNEGIQRLTQAGSERVRS